MKDTWKKVVDAIKSVLPYIPKLILKMAKYQKGRVLLAAAIAPLLRMVGIDAPIETIRDGVNFVLDFLGSGAISADMTTGLVTGGALAYGTFMANESWSDVKAKVIPQRLYLHDIRGELLPSMRVIPIDGKVKMVDYYEIRGGMLYVVTTDGMSKAVDAPKEYEQRIYEYLKGRT
jgi:uncharacterized membrane protein